MCPNYYFLEKLEVRQVVKKFPEFSGTILATADQLFLQ